MLLLRRRRPRRRKSPMMIWALVSVQCLVSSNWNTNNYCIGLFD
jgi:hypothetical protein